MNVIGYSFQDSIIHHVIIWWFSLTFISWCLILLLTWSHFQSFVHLETGAKAKHKPCFSFITIFTVIRTPAPLTLHNSLLLPYLAKRTSDNITRTWAVWVGDARLCISTMYHGCARCPTNAKHVMEINEWLYIVWYKLLNPQTTFLWKSSGWEPLV